MAKISEEPDSKQRKKAVTFKTFKKWPFHEGFSSEAGYIMSLVCKVCRGNSANKRNGVRLGGIKTGCRRTICYILPIPAIWKYLSKLEVYMIGLRRNTLVVLHLKPQMFMSLER